jgi:L-seryl-tRNA(Ser) seleniumtransferase
MGAPPDRAALLRQLPKVDRLLASPALGALPRAVALYVARAELEAARQAVLAGELAELPDIAASAAARGRELLAGKLVEVINATGVVLHTNLGRAPWSAEAVAAAAQVARGYSNLELDLAAGVRGGRTRGPERLLCYLTGAEAAVVVNNNAAAVLLALTALAHGKEVVVSRGELVEIGGSFRVPDVIASGGARLVDVGTTNRTRVADYERALTPDTSVILKVHRSNFRLVGFTEEPERSELVALARARGVAAVEDLGSGYLLPIPGVVEPDVRSVVATGMDLVCFSGDKLLGGPQAGLIVGRASVVARLRKHPMYRALRLDKTILAALEATLAQHAAGNPPPAVRRLSTPPAVLEDRAAALVAALGAVGVAASVRAVEDAVGGGALPGEALAGFAARVEAPHLEALAAALRTGTPAVVARVADGALWLHVRTLTDADLPRLAGAVAEARGTG